MTDKRKSLIKLILCTFLIWAAGAAILWFALTRLDGIQWVLCVCGALISLLGGIPACLVFLAFTTKNEPSAFDMDNYADFIGRLTAV